MTSDDSSQGKTKLAYKTSADFFQEKQNLKTDQQDTR
jgi:hypothetical protein